MQTRIVRWANIMVTYTHTLPFEFRRAKNKWGKYSPCLLPISIHLLKYDTRVWRFDGGAIYPLFSCLITLITIWRCKVYFPHLLLAPI